ncbi:hypothetical protein [Siminovitchia fortis]|uniref:hypothetical protein n=1 Tax=Siminovitchia fortis TaxID=254758 RepID=UPI00119CF722|nr:hypothetical protein [Siminovitchia fortis]
MSFVSIMASSNFVNVVSDGRVSYGGASLQENYKKFKKISEKQFIAFAGAKELCENVINQVDYLEKTHYDLHQVAREIHSVIYNNISLYSYKMMFCVGGINFNGKIEFYTVNKNSSKIGIFKPSSSTDINYAFLSPDVSDQILDEKLNEFASIFGADSSSKCLKIQKALNDFVASIDNTVNTNTSTLTIK